MTNAPQLILRNNTAFSRIRELASLAIDVDSTFPLPNGVKKLVLTGKLCLDYAESERWNKQLVISHYSRNRPSEADRLADNWWRNEICVPFPQALGLLQRALQGLWTLGY